MKGVALFDIDNTLLYTGGAGSAAMTRAFADIYGVADAFADVEFQGRTDLAILDDALCAHDLPNRGAAGELRRFLEVYLPHLDVALAERSGHLKPGIPRLLDALRAAGLALGVATGNVREGAIRKLRHYGLHTYFERGGFGDGTTDRAAMVREAVGEFAGRADGTPVYVVGDTPGDVASAKLNGVFAVGVATGSHSVKELTEAGADLAFPDLGDVDRVVAELASLREGAAEARNRPASR